ncbi:MAG: AraC family transcriptional regulator [Clostridia bacterium]|nr:AraC family transcriptional regulator [Clostridia bacterium]NLS85393.1 helix-turn-helix transcriptional regulator [Oscillospiraceae bacterium]
MNEQLLAVQRMQDYIEKHIDSDITAAQLARAALFSPWHSYRLFKLYTSLTPAQYIRRLRLSMSALRLKNEDCRVLDAALDLGFGSVDGYQRAFYKEFGCNPREYAQNPVPITLFIPYGVKFRELRKDEIDMENLQSVFVQRIKKPARKVIIKRGVKAEDYFPYCEEVGCDVWGLLTSMDSLCGEPVCLWLPQKYIKPHTSTYVQGVEVADDYDGTVPEGFDVIALPEAEYLMFQGEPFEEENYCEAILAVQHAMEKYNPDTIGYEWNTENPRIQLEPLGTRGYIELKAVKRK